MCTQISNNLSSPDVASIKYLSDGKLLKSNVYLTDFFDLDLKNSQNYNLLEYNTKVQIFLTQNLSENLERRFNDILNSDFGIRKFVETMNKIYKSNYTEFLKNNRSKDSLALDMAAFTAYDKYYKRYKDSFHIEVNDDLNAFKFSYISPELGYKKTEKSGFIDNNTIYTFFYRTPNNEYEANYNSLNTIRDSFISDLLLNNSNSLHNQTNYSLLSTENIRNFLLKLSNFFNNNNKSYQYKEYLISNNFNHHNQNHNFNLEIPFGWNISWITTDRQSFNFFEDGDLNIRIDFYSAEYIYKRYSMIIDIKSVFDMGPDYRLERFWSSQEPYDYRTWYKSSFELSSNGNSTLISNSIDNNFIDYPKLNIGKNGYSIPFEFDLGLLNYPEQYNVNVLFEEGYRVKIINGTDINCNRADVSQWLPVPPPKLSMFLSSNSLDLRPGETKNIILKINNNANLNSKLVLSDSSFQNLAVEFFPNPIFVSPFSNATSIVKITAPSYNKTDTIPVRINSDIEFPQNITIIGTNTTINNISDAKIKMVRDFTVNLLPPYRFEENLSNFVNNVITPLNSIWTFIAGVGVVLSPKIIQFISKITQNNKNNQSRDKRVE
jgi:hypothetical protein